MNLQTLTLILKTKDPVTESPEKLRGFIGNRFKDYPVLHQHAENGKNSYQYPKVQYKIIEKSQEFGCSDSFMQYKFIVPWIALNEINYDSYIKFDPKNKVNLLHQILAGNLLSISKSLGYVVLNQIKVRTKLSPIKVYSKGIPLIGFKGDFQINFMIPEYLGIGKSVSRGFGVVRRCNL